MSHKCYQQVHDSVYEEQIMEAFKVFDYVSLKSDHENENEIPVNAW